MFGCLRGGHSWAMAIARIWRGTVPTSRADEYVEYLRTTGIADILSTPGNRGALLLRREDGEHTHFSTISLWDSEEAIEAFSGSSDRTARLEPRDEEFLVDSEPEAEHHVIALGLD
jgi:heme-degrading monooxygenase HmoA